MVEGSEFFPIQLTATGFIVKIVISECLLLRREQQLTSCEDNWPQKCPAQSSVFHCIKETLDWTFSSVGILEQRLRGIEHYISILQTEVNKI